MTKVEEIHTNFSQVKEIFEGLYEDSSENFSKNYKFEVNEDYISPMQEKEILKKNMGDNFIHEIQPHRKNTLTQRILTCCSTNLDNVILI